jgi:hypothetical protein
LNPDIAVLEGGYSIQGALPYVNLGIVLAMAGLDYSYVWEPDYHQDKLRQSSQVTDYIKRLSDKMVELYQSPEQIHNSWPKQGRYFHRTKNIFYDTAYISEHQHEYLRDCDHCRGLLKIETSSTTSKDCLGREIPLGACEKCREKGYQAFEEAKKQSQVSNIQLIDRQGGESFRCRK